MTEKYDYKKDKIDTTEEEKNKKTPIVPVTVDDKNIIEINDKIELSEEEKKEALKEIFGDEYNSYYESYKDNKFFYNTKITKKFTEKIKSELEEKGYKVFNVLGNGCNGSAYNAEDKNGDEIVIKISEDTINNEEKIRNIENFDETLSIVGGGFTKPMEKYTFINNGVKYSVEVLKKRAMDLNDIISYKDGTIEKEKKDKINDNKEKKDIINNFSPMAAMAQLITALEVAHSNDLALGDIKSENIFINEKGIVKLSDPFKFHIKSTERKFFNECQKNDICHLGFVFIEIINNKKHNNEILTTDDIILDNLFPNIDFTKQPEVEIELKERFVEIVNGMIVTDLEKMLSISEVKEKFITLTKYISENVKTKEDVNIDLKKDLKLRSKDMYNLGFIDKLEEGKLEKFKEKYLNDLNLLLGNITEEEVKEKYKDNPEKANKKIKKYKTHLQTITGGKELSEEAKIYLNQLKDCLTINNGAITIDNDKLKEITIDETLKETNDREYQIINKKLKDLERLKLAEIKKESIENKETIEINEERPEKDKKEEVIQDDTISETNEEKIENNNLKNLKEMEQKLTNSLNELKNEEKSETLTVENLDLNSFKAPVDVYNKIIEPVLDNIKNTNSNLSVKNIKSGLSNIFKIVGEKGYFTNKTPKKILIAKRSLQGYIREIPKEQQEQLRKVLTDKTIQKKLNILSKDSGINLGGLLVDILNIERSI